MAPDGDVTRLLQAWRRGDKSALDALLPLVHEELRRLAKRHMRNERPDHTLQASGLVNEAYLRLIEERGVDWRDRAHFFGVAAHLMRFILVDYARRRAMAKRGGGAVPVTLDEQIVRADDPAFGLMAVDQALDKLAAMDERQSRVAELKLFAGLTLEETAEVLAVSTATVTRDWRLAKAWLQRELA